jgi:hypothetical protein
MKCLSYDGILFADLHVGAGIDPLTDQGPYRTPIVLRRAGTSPVHAGVDQDAATTSVTFTVKPSYATEATLLALLGALNPDSDQERPFVGLLDDGVTQVSRNMAVATWRFSNANRLIVDFSAADPVWRAESDTTGAVSTDNALIDLNPSFLTDLSGWQVDTSSGTPTWSWDGVVYHANAGSLNLAWVGPASTSPIGAAYRNTTFIPVRCGRACHALAMVPHRQRRCDSAAPVELVQRGACVLSSRSRRTGRRRSIRGRSARSPRSRRPEPLRFAGDGRCGQADEHQSNGERQFR